MIAEVAEGDVEDINRAVSAARKAFDEGPWPKMTAYVHYLPYFCVFGDYYVKVMYCATNSELSFDRKDQKSCSSLLIYLNSTQKRSLLLKHGTTESHTNKLLKSNYQCVFVK